MKTLQRIMLSLTVAGAIAGAPVYGSQEPDEKPKPEEPKKKQEPQPQPKPKPKEEKPKPEPAPAPKAPKEEEKKEKERSQENTKQQREQDKRTQANVQKEAGRGQKIPPQKFQASFGQQHHFRVTRSGGDNRRFQYSGYVFEVVDVWPVGWSFDDECYIEEDGDDYYLVDVVHPEMRVIVIVVSG
jgi:hypothetical protein